MDDVTLVAMARTGETFVVRDEFGQVWLMQPEAAGGPYEIGEEIAERLIADRDLDRIDQSFANWPALDAFRLQRAAEVTPEVIVDRDAMDLDDVRRMLRVAQRWAADGETQRAAQLCLALLDIPVVLADRAIHAQLVAEVGKATQPPSGMRSAPTDPVKAAAHKQWQATKRLEPAAA